jgi:chromosome segregation ATPase
MGRSQKRRFFVTREETLRQEKDKRLQEERVALERQVSSSMVLLAGYQREVLALSKALGKLSSLSNELNYWYGKYSTFRQKYEEAISRLNGYSEQNHALARRLEEVQVSWRYLDNQLRQRSAEFHFPYVSRSTHFKPY